MNHMTLRAVKNNIEMKLNELYEVFFSICHSPTLLYPCHPICLLRLLQNIYSESRTRTRFLHVLHGHALWYIISVNTEWVGEVDGPPAPTRPDRKLEQVSPIVVVHH